MKKDGWLKMMVFTCSPIIRHLIYPIYERYTRQNVLKNLKELEQNQWLSLKEIKRIQWKKLKKILEHAYANVPYYQRLFNRLGTTPDEINNYADFIRLPLLSKEDIRKNISDIIASKTKKEDLIPNSTGGSTGVNLNFYSDRNYLKFSGAILWRNNRWVGVDIGEKQIKIWGSHYDVSRSKRLRGKIRNRIITRTIYLSSYDMSKKNMLDYRNKINKFKPQLITGYASALYLFAQFLDEKNLDIYTPKGLISSAEVLYEHQKELIESVFGCKVFNRYGCREVGNIAHECEEQKGFHINAESVYVEVIDENEKPCKPAEKGELVVTDLNNYVFPFIRYKIEDIGILSDKKCRCGRGLPLLKKVEGRVWDVIIGANGNRLVGTFWLVWGVEGIQKFQVIQEEFGEIIIKLMVDKSFTDKERGKLLKRIYSKCGEDMKVDIRLVDEIPLTKSGKHRFIISRISPFVK